MTKNSKQMLLFAAFLLSMLLISAIHSSVVAIAHATEPTIREKGESILSDVAGLDLAEYVVAPKEYPQSSYFEVVPEENVGYTLRSDASKLDVFCTFANGELHVLHVLEVQGSPSMTRASNSVLDMAKGFLNDYASYSGKTLYAELGSTLDTVDASENSILVSGNVKLQVDVTDNYVTFKWTYTVNGVGGGDKCVALGYKEGFLKYFVDTWDLYPVGSTAVNLSEEEAVAIAMERAKTYSYEVGSGDETLEVKDFKVTRAMVTQLVFCTSIGADEARNDNVLTLYPMWRIGVGLDKFYPGNVYGIYVDVWADTKEIRHIQEAFSTLPPELVSEGLFDEGDTEALDGRSSVNEAAWNSASIFWIAFPAVAIIVFGIAPIWFARKKSLLRFRRLPRLHSSRFTMGLCLLLSSTLLIGSISTVYAKHRATIWGDKEVNKTQTEKDYQTWIAGNVTNFFAANGYLASNYQGENTQKDMFLYLIDDSEQNYPKAAVVYFDHGVGDQNQDDDNRWHYQVLDNYGASIFDSGIYPQTAPGKTFFAFISTCMSANLTYARDLYGAPYGGGNYSSGTAIGMPYAWTHRTVGEQGEGFSTALNMSIDGYDDPDEGDFVYIGFPYGSASLSQTVDPNFPSTCYGMWVWEFFEYTLYNHWSVNYALDQASLLLFNEEFCNIDLHTGFYPVWGEQWPTLCTMVVYGNGNLHLKLPAEISIAACVYTPPIPPYATSVNVYVDGYFEGVTNNGVYIPVTEGYHTVEVDDYGSGYPFQCFWVDGQYLWENPITVYADSETTPWVVAFYGY